MITIQNSASNRAKVEVEKEFTPEQEVAGPLNMPFCLSRA